MFRGPLHLRRLRNDRRYRFAPWCRIDGQGPLHIPYGPTQPTPFASLRLCVRHWSAQPMSVFFAPLRLCVRPAPTQELRNPQKELLDHKNTP